MTGRWLPVAWSSSVPDGRVQPADLDGLPLALWRDASGTVVALVDRCPHRGYPLSEGRVEGGALRCGYHGWSFDAGGRCRAVPGLRDVPPRGERDARERDARGVPVLESSSLVWAWSGEGSPRGEPPAVDPGARALTIRWSFTLKGRLADVAENILDVPHTAYLHGGLFRTPGSARPIRVDVRRAPRSIEAEFVGEPVPSGLLGRLLVPRGGTLRHVDRFVMPCVAQVEYAASGGLRLLATSFLAPAGETTTRAFHALSVEPRWAAVLALPILAPAAWWVLRQDARALELQSRNESRFGARRRISTEADVLGPHVEQMLLRASRGDEPLPEASWSVVLQR